MATKIPSLKENKLYYFCLVVFIVSLLVSIITGIISNTGVEGKNACKEIHISKGTENETTLKINGSETSYPVLIASGSSECAKLFYSSWVIAIFSIIFLFFCWMTFPKKIIKA